MLSTVEIKDKLTTEDIIRLCCFLQGSDDYYYDSQGNLIFNTVLDHKDGESWKLYYFPETKLFHCFTGSGDSYDIFELVSRFLDIDFKEALKYIIKFFKIKGSFKDEETPQLTDDWDIFQQVEDYEKISHEDNSIEPIQSNLLEYFYPLAAPIEWQKDGITPEVMRYYNIRIDAALHKIIIPHQDINGNLIGIRGRSYDPIEVADGRKYMPVFIEGDIYKHPLGKNLFGLYQNKETIKRLKKVCVFEAEKSVMQIASMYGIDNCFAVATCGSNLSFSQIDMLLKLGVDELILAFDADHLGDRSDPDTIEYQEKLYKIVEGCIPYINVSIIFDYDHILPHKASPSDCGKEIFEKLYKSRIRIVPEKSKILEGNKNARKR